jgi:hypothetical protein
MSLVFYLKTIGENVDPSARIMFPKTDGRLDRWIFMNHNFFVYRKIRNLPLLPFLFSRPYGKDALFFYF